MSFEDQEKDRQRKMVDDAVTKLREHFDSVRIFVTCPTSDGGQMTRSLDRGSGNWFAQYGQVKEWVIAMEERVRISERGRSE